MTNDLSRLFSYSMEFYLSRMQLILVFSIPAIVAFFIPIFVPAPTFVSLCGEFLRTGSIPDLSLSDILLTGAGYVLSMFLIVETIVNINLIIKSKRTMTEMSKEVIAAIGKYSSKIFVLCTIALLVIFIFQIVTYWFLQSLIFPFILLFISVFLFFAPAAIVIDGYDLQTAAIRSARMCLARPEFFLSWAVANLICLSFFWIFFGFLQPPFSNYLLLITNALFILPFFVVLQTQMYMEKYPLAR